MNNPLFDQRKVKSNDIVNGLARRDIFDSKGTLLVKEGTRISEVHYQRMREEGLIQEDLHKKSDQGNKLDINFVSSHSLHGRLDNIILKFMHLQKNLIEATRSDEQFRQQLDDIITRLLELCDENIFQVLGELYLADLSNYNFIKPLYVSASLTELIKRYNDYKPEDSIDAKKRHHLLYAALLYNIGLLKLERNIYSESRQLSPEEKQVLRVNYPTESIRLLKLAGIEDGLTVEVVKQHNVAASNPSFAALLLRTPFIYSGIAMPQFIHRNQQNLCNPCREFAIMFTKKKLDPILGGLFLKINGLVPVGSIMQFDSREKAIVIEGPGSDNISSSRLRILTNKTGMQLSRPGDTFFLHKTLLKQKGLADHHQFAWNKFAPFVMWER